MEDKSKSQGSDWSDWAWNTSQRFVEWYWAVFGIVASSIFMLICLALAVHIDQLPYIESIDSWKSTLSSALLVLGFCQPIVMGAFVYLIFKDIHFIKGQGTSQKIE